MKAQPNISPSGSIPLLAQLQFHSLHKLLDSIRGLMEHQAVAGKEFVIKRLDTLLFCWPLEPAQGVFAPGVEKTQPVG